MNHPEHEPMRGRGMEHDHPHDMREQPRPHDPHDRPRPAQPRDMHDHPHPHDPHDHPHPHDPHDHPHPHDPHDHPHPHPHDPHCDHGIDCDHDCAGCQNMNPRDELIALMRYMVGHNASHAEELAKMAGRLRDMGEGMAYDQVMMAVSDFEKGNMRLSTVLAALGGV